MKLVSISGLDGSGKSTQINLLKEYLENQGKKVFYFHAVQFSIANSHNIKHGTLNIARESKSVTNASWFKIQLRKIALVIDIFRFKKLVKKLAIENYDYIVSDRYFYDNLINIAYLEAKSQKLKANSCAPHPDFAFYLNADPEKIMQRDRVPEQGLKYLRKKKMLFDSFSQENKLTVLDGNKNKDEIFEEIKSKLT